MQYPATDGEFDPTKHTIVPGRHDTLKMVRRLSDGHANLFVLADKKDSLCRLVHLQKEDTEDRMVFYSEWGVHRGTRYGLESSCLEEKVSLFAKGYLADHQSDLIDTTMASDKARSNDWGPSSQHSSCPPVFHPPSLSHV